MDDENLDGLVGTAREQETPSNPTKISDLNDYCLIHIFQYLNILDKLRLEGVCKRWQGLLKNSWYNFKSLRFDNYDWGFKKSSDLSSLNTRNLKKVLSRCGQFVTDVEFHDSHKKLGPTVLGTIAKHCPNVEYIFAPDVKFKPDSIKELAERCSGIVDLTLGDSTSDCDEALALLFRSNAKLRDVYFSSNYKITGECLSALNADSIENIFFDNCPRISLKHFGVFRNFKNLKSLSVEHFHDSSKETANDISECFKSLQHLAITMCPAFPFSRSHVAKLKNLQMLDVSSNDSITDNLLVAVAENCKLLKKVNVSFCLSVTNRGLAPILTLPNLEILYVEELDGISDEVFNRAPKLVELNCSYCDNMRDEGLSRLIKNSHNIEHIYLIGCEGISNRLIRDAVQYTKKRTNNVVLNIHLSNSKVKLRKFTDRSPLLQVIPSIVVDRYE